MYQKSMEHLHTTGVFNSWNTYLGIFFYYDGLFIHVYWFCFHFDHEAATRFRMFDRMPFKYSF